MKKGTIILIILITLALGITPFFFTREVNETITVGAGIIGALASIITLLIALLLYSKYGVEKSVINKQTEAVFHLLTELKKTRFLILWDEGNLLQLSLDTLGDEFLMDYENKKLLFSRSYIEEVNNIWEMAEDVFLPINIVDKIRPLMVQVISWEKDKKDYMLVIVPGSSTKSEDDLFGKLNQKDMTLKEFIYKWTLVIEESKKWLKEYSNATVNLNFERN